MSKKKSSQVKKNVEQFNHIKCGIYCIHNSKYFYIGKASNIKRRWSTHKRKLARNEHDNIIMQRVYNKYSENDPFVYEVIINCERKDLNWQEGLQLGKYILEHEDMECMNIANPVMPEFNLTKSGDLIENISNDLIEPITYGEFKTDKRGTAPWRWQRVVLLDMEGNLIKVWESASIAQAELDIVIHMERPTSGGFLWQKYDEWTKNPKKKVHWKVDLYRTIKQYSKAGDFLKEWKSAKQAAKESGINYSTIKLCLCNKCKTAGGYVWSYGEFPNKNYSKSHKSPIRSVALIQDGKTVCVFRSLKDAAKIMNIGIPTVKKYAENGLPLFGYIWELRGKNDMAI